MRGRCLLTEGFRILDSDFAVTEISYTSNTHLSERTRFGHNVAGLKCVVNGLSEELKRRSDSTFVAVRTVKIPSLEGRGKGNGG